MLPAFVIKEFSIWERLLGEGKRTARENRLVSDYTSN